MKRKIADLILYNKNTQWSVKFFWITLCALLFCVLFLKLEKSLNAFWFVYFEQFKEDILIHAIVFIGLFMFFIVSGGIFISSLALHKLRRQPSWFFYFTQGFIWGNFIFLLVRLVLKVKYYISTLPSYTCYNFNYSFLISFFRENWFLIILLFLVLTLYKFVSKKDISEFESFASEAVSIDQDEFDFKTSAINNAKGINAISKYISVLSLYGRMGSGKSSFTRMIIESLDKNDTLYTYISLTETNEAQDFSKLFADRWKKTLSERYTKIDIVDYLPLVNTILREGGHGLWSSILGALEKFNFGISKTISKSQDFTIANKRFFTSKTIGGIFGNIPLIKEDKWIIVIDEIERAQFDEIYRVVEIIERFKNEGRTGLPLKLIFILCISRDDLNSLLNTFKKTDVRAYQLEDFFNDGKSITQPIFVPPLSDLVVESFVRKKTLVILNNEDLDVDKYKELRPNTIGLPTFRYIDSPVEALNYVTGLISTKTPRQINRVFNSLIFFFDSFKTLGGDQKKDFVRFADLLLMEYIKINHPSLVEFFKKTVGSLVISTEPHNIMNWHIKHDLREKKLDLLGWIELVLGRELSAIEKVEFPILIALVANSYNDFLTGQDSEENKKLQYEGTLSYPENLNDYLTVVAENTKTTFKKNNGIYRKHLESKEIIESLEAIDLVSYARFLSNLQIKQINLYLDIYKKLKQILVSGELELSRGNTGDTLYDEAVFRFVYTAVIILEKENAQSTLPSDNIKEVFGSIKEVLLSPKVTLAGKLIILNSYLNNERGSGSTLHGLITSVYEKTNKYFRDEWQKIIEDVFTDFDQRYFIERRVIYENEENYFYCMYQNWSGKVGNKIERKKMRTIAFNGLAKHPEFIKVYWDRYPDPSEYKDFEDLLSDHRLFTEDFRSIGLYMPLRNLIAVTKLSGINNADIIKKMTIWSSHSFMNSERFKELSILHDTKDTLKSFLLRQGLIEEN